MAMLANARSIVAVLGLAIAWPGCITGRHPVRTGTPSPDQVSQLWIDVDPVSRDLRDGPGADVPKPADEARYDIVEIDTRGYSVTYRVKDASGREWNVKLGPEAQPEVVTSRILWAVGYHQLPAFFVDRWIAYDTKRKLGALRGGARFRPHELGLKSEGVWAWERNPFVGTRPLNGLLALMMLLNSTDLKTDNNEMYRVDGGAREGASRWFIVKDLGATLGETGVMDPRRGYLEGFEREPFVHGVGQDGWVRFAYRGWHRSVVSRVPVDDLKWMCERVLRLTDAQWRDAFRAARYDDDQTRRFVARIKQKAAEGMALR
jgi:hypothetical protein